MTAVHSLAIGTSLADNSAPAPKILRRIGKATWLVLVEEDESHKHYIQVETSNLCRQMRDKKKVSTNGTVTWKRLTMQAGTAEQLPDSYQKALRELGFVHVFQGLPAVDLNSPRNRERQNHFAAPLSAKERAALARELSK